MSEQAVQPSTPREAEMSVRSLLIPLDGKAMLVPNAMVSEVAALGEVTPVAGAPAWWIGNTVWRGLRIPVVAFERLTGGKGGTPGRHSRAIVFNTLNGNRSLPFIAVVSQRIPRLLLVTGRMLRTLDDGALPEEGVLTRMEMHGDKVVVPDLDRLEQMLLQLNVRVERVIG